MTISESIFVLLEERGITQKEFSERTGIAQSTISDWKRSYINLIAEKIMSICDVREVNLAEILMGAEIRGSGNNTPDYYVIDKGTKLGMFLENYQWLDKRKKERRRGEMMALKDMRYVIIIRIIGMKYVYGMRLGEKEKVVSSGEILCNESV